jgi:hypothetical protein
LDNKIVFELETSIGAQGFDYSFEIWIDNSSMRLNKFVYLNRILPAVNLAIETQVQDDKSWCSCHSSSTVDIYLFTLGYSIDHSVQSMASIE